jgi:hypothetical protein
LLLPGHKDPTMVAFSDVELSSGDGDLAACIRSAGTHLVLLPSSGCLFLYPDLDSERPNLNTNRPTWSSARPHLPQPNSNSESGGGSTQIRGGEVTDRGRRKKYKGRRRSRSRTKTTRDGRPDAVPFPR